MLLLLPCRTAIITSDGADKREMEQIGRETGTVMRPCLSACFVSNIISDSEAKCGLWRRLEGRGRRDGEQRLEQDESAVLLAVTGF